MIRKKHREFVPKRRRQLELFIAFVRNIGVYFARDRALLLACRTWADNDWLWVPFLGVHSQTYFMYITNHGQVGRICCVFFIEEHRVLLFVLFFVFLAWNIILRHPGVRSGVTKVNPVASPVRIK